MKRSFLLAVAVLLMFCAYPVIEEQCREAKQTVETYVRKTDDEKIEEPKELYARSAVLMDADSGRVLFGKDANVVRPMASTTKIMTCILALEQMEEQQIAEVSKTAAGQPRVKLGVQCGENYYIRDLLYSLMLESHNDSAVVIAEGIAGSVESFADKMNAKARALGCEQTHFVTPNGLDGEDAGGVHATTAIELARILRYCIKESPKREEFLKITRTPSYTFQDYDKKRSFACSNHNAFLKMMDGALTGKTGFTTNAGYCYVAALKVQERTFLVALLACGWPGNKGYKWKDTRKLFTYGINNYHYRSPWEENIGTLTLQPLPVKGGIRPKNPYASGTGTAVGMRREDLKQAKDYRVLLRDDAEITVKITCKKQLSAPVHAGEPVGKLTYLTNGDTLKTYPILTRENIRRRDYRWCMTLLMKEFLL